jgi:hypothetical protein
VNQTQDETYHTIGLEGHLTPEDKSVSSYRLLPFEVPAGMARLEVSYRFSNDNPGGYMRPPGNILDIGLFDPRGSEFLRARGFRGWSGSARREFFLSSEDATPGYLPGPILPGQWEIILGLYHILPHGCDYCVTISLFAGEPSNFVGADLSPWPVSRRESGWYRGDLHCHTHHSDASGSLADLVAAARAQRLDFLAVTDHNTISHLPHLAAQMGPNLLLISGQEITTEQGHANAWGIHRWHDFRCEGREQMAQVVADVRSTGGLVSVNHPKEGGPPWLFGDEAQFDCLEVWQAPWFTFNDQSLALWHRLLCRGHRITGVGGSDMHQSPFDGRVGRLAVGKPCTWIYAEELSVAGILEGIKAGHVYISEDVTGPKVFLNADADDDGCFETVTGDLVKVSAGTRLALRCRVIGAEACELCIRSKEKAFSVIVDRRDFTYEWTVRPNEDTFFRVEVIDRPEPPHVVVRALSNPIYVTIQPSR